MIEILPNVVPLLSVALLQTRFVRGLIMRLFPGAITGWPCALLPWICK